MDGSDLLSSHAKTIIGGAAVYCGLTLNEWFALAASIFAIIFAVVNTIAVLPRTIEVIKQFIAKVRNRGSE